MATLIKNCLTCGKTIKPVAQYCPRCGSAFLRISEALPLPAAPPVCPSTRLRPQWELVPIEFAHPWPWYVGRVLRRAWGLILAFW